MKTKPLLAIIMLCATIAACGLSSKAHRIVGEVIEKEVAHCGNSYFTIEDGSTIKEIKDFDFTIRPSTISEADRLNGFEFIGAVNPNYSAIRFADKNKRCWYGWETRDGSFDLYFFRGVSKKNGKWQVDSSAYNHVAPDCSAIPQLPDCSVG